MYNLSKKIVSGGNCPKKSSDAGSERSRLGRDIGTWLERRSGPKILIWHGVSSLLLPIYVITPRLPLLPLCIPLRRVVVIQRPEREVKDNLGLTMEIISQRELTPCQINIFWPDLLSSQVPMSLPSLKRTEPASELFLGCTSGCT